MSIQSHFLRSPLVTLHPPPPPWPLFASCPALGNRGSLLEDSQRGVQTVHTSSKSSRALCYDRAAALNAQVLSISALGSSDMSYCTAQSSPVSLNFEAAQSAKCPYSHRPIRHSLSCKLLTSHRWTKNCLHVIHTLKCFTQGLN